MSRALRWAWLLGALWLAVSPLGCGSSLTGGSIPPGRSRASGIVVRGDNAGVRLPGSVLRFSPAADSRRRASDSEDTGSEPPEPPDFDDDDDGGGSSGGNPPGTVLTATDANGEFNVDGLPSDGAELRVTPPSGSGLQPITYDLDFSDGATYWMICAPLPTGANLSGLSGIEVSPNELRLAVGQSVQLVVQLQGGDPPALVPSYLVRGDMGVVNEQGRFTAVRTGRGTVRVVLGPYEATIPVAVAAAR